MYIYKCVCVCVCLCMSAYVFVCLYVCVRLLVVDKQLFFFLSILFYFIYML